MARGKMLYAAVHSLQSFDKSLDQVNYERMKLRLFDCNCFSLILDSFWYGLAKQNH